MTKHIVHASLTIDIEGADSAEEAMETAIRNYLHNDLDADMTINAIACDKDPRTSMTLEEFAEEYDRDVVGWPLTTDNCHPANPEDITVPPFDVWYWLRQNRELVMKHYGYTTRTQDPV